MEVKEKTPSYEKFTRYAKLNSILGGGDNDFYNLLIDIKDNLVLEEDEADSCSGYVSKYIYKGDYIFSVRIKVSEEKCAFSFNGSAYFYDMLRESYGKEYPRYKNYSRMNLIVEKYLNNYLDIW
jgi:hypothetical protein